jgi:flavodoxin I
MSKVAVVYWSGTGNTEEMANKVAEGAKAAGAEVEVISADDFDGTDISSFDGVAFGCPAMGDEELEEGEFEPFFSDLEGKLSGKKVALFGSYDWGDGEWMRTWCGRAKDAGAELVDDEGLIVNNTPDDEGLAACRELGGKLA